MKIIRQCAVLVSFLAVAVVFSSSAQELFVYGNLATSSSQNFLNGGAANVSGNTITTLVADDITPLSGYAGSTISNIYFSVANNNPAAVSARARIRIWSADGASGGPGTILAGFTFNPISFAASTASLFYFSPGGLTVPSGTFWMGLTFDDNTGGTGASAAQLNNLGMALFNPPTIGTSTDLFFHTTAAGSFLANNPVGTLGNLGGNPPANFYFGISVVPVPEPASFALAGLGFAAFLICRRQTK
jgi:hypothetical protein